MTYAFRAEKEKASVTGALGASGLFIAFQVRAQEQADFLAGSLPEAAEAVMARQETDAGAALVSADEVFDPFIQFVLQTCETENRLPSQARKVSAPPIHSSLLRISRQWLSAGFAQALERPPLLRRRRPQPFGRAPGFEPEQIATNTGGWL